MVRLGQRTELDAYFRQFLTDLATVAGEDLMLAKARAVSLVSTLITSVLEIGAPAGMETIIAQAAADFSDAADAQDLVNRAEQYLTHAAVCARPNANRFALQTIQQCQALIAERFGENLTDERLAEQVGLSRSHFRFLFREVTGMPFKRYLSQVRLAAARQLIRETRTPIREICANVGYSDLSTFNRAYRAYHGVPPTADRHATV